MPCCFVQDPNARDRGTAQGNALHQVVIQRRMRQQDQPAQGNNAKIKEKDKEKEKEGRSYHTSISNVFIGDER